MLGSPRADPSHWNLPLACTQGGASLTSRAASGKELHLATAQLGPAQAGSVMGVEPLLCRNQAAHCDRPCANLSKCGQAHDIRRSARRVPSQAATTGAAATCQQRF